MFLCEENELKKANVKPIDRNDLLEMTNNIENSTEISTQELIKIYNSQAEETNRKIYEHDRELIKLDKEKYISIDLGDDNITFAELVKYPGFCDKVMQNRLKEYYKNKNQNAYIECSKSYIKQLEREIEKNNIKYEKKVFNNKAYIEVRKESEEDIRKMLKKVKNMELER